MFYFCVNIRVSVGKVLTTAELAEQKIGELQERAHIAMEINVCET